MSKNNREPEHVTGPWRGVPMTTLRLQTIWLNKFPRPTTTNHTGETK